MSDHRNHEQHFQKMGKIVHKFKSETHGKFTVNNKQTATVRRVLSLRTLCLTQR